MIPCNKKEEIHHMNKRTFSMMLAILAIAGAVSACGDAGTGETKQTNACLHKCFPGQVFHKTHPF